MYIEATPEMILGVTTAFALTLGLWYVGYCLERYFQNRRKRHGPDKFRWTHKKEL